MQSVLKQSTQTPSALALKAAWHAVCEDCIVVLSCLADDGYTQQTQCYSSIGKHLRHVLDRMSSVLDGLPNFHINYDMRTRCPECETCKDVCRQKINDIQVRIQALPHYSNSDMLTIQESIPGSDAAPVIASTAQREIHDVIVHTVHHLAMIKMIAAQQGIILSDSFGKAASTIVFEQQ